MKKKIMKGIACMCVVGGAYFAGTLKKMTTNKNQEKNDKAIHHRLNTYYDIMTLWMQHIQEDRYIGEYLYDHGFHSIAIYGRGKIGTLLYQELRNSKVKVKCFVDEVTREEFKGIDDIPNIVIKDISKQDVDAVVVTPCFDMKNITKVLLNAGCNTKIVSLYDVLFEM